MRWLRSISMRFYLLLLWLRSLRVPVQEPFKKTTKVHFFHFISNLNKYVRSNLFQRPKIDLTWWSCTCSFWSIQIYPMLKATNLNHHLSIIKLFETIKFLNVISSKPLKKSSTLIKHFINFWLQMLGFLCVILCKGLLVTTH